jgi:hypothetical protein
MRGRVRVTSKASKASKNGPGTFSEALAAFEVQALELPAEPAADPYVAVAFALGWVVGDALICFEDLVFKHWCKFPSLALRPTSGICW